jgi:hypothetical protein
VIYAPFGGDATLASATVADNTISDDLLGLTGSDWEVMIADGAPWLLGRFFVDAVRRYDGMDFSAPILEFSTGAGTNPRSIAVCADRIYVSRYDITEGDTPVGGDVGIFDLATGGPLGSVDVSSFNPPEDGTPEPDRLVAVGNTIYVALQRLDRDAGWTPDDAGKLVAIDCTTGTVTGDWDVGPNPVISAVAADPTLIQIVYDGGVALFDTTAETVQNVVDDFAMGEGYDSLTAVATGEAVLLVTELNFGTNEVWCMDLLGGTQTMLTSVPQRNWETIAAPDGNVWVLWRDHWATDTEVEVGGVTVYDPVTCTEVTSTWMSFGSDPSSLAFFDAAAE